MHFLAAYVAAHKEKDAQLPDFDHFLPYPPRQKRVKKPNRELTEGQRKLLAQCHKCIDELEG